MKKIFKTIRGRWTAEMPKIFSWIFRASLAVSGTALAIQTAFQTGGANVPEWWSVVYPYLIGVGAGMASVAKLTREGNDTDNQ